MATYTGQMRFSNGQTLHIYFASSQAVGTYVTCDTTQAAGTASPTDFRLATNAKVIDFITDDTAGMMEFIADGRPTGVTVLTTAAHGATNSGRPAIPVLLRAGVSYRLKQIVAGAA